MRDGHSRHAGGSKLQHGRAWTPPTPCGARFHLQHAASVHGTRGLFIHNTREYTLWRRISVCIWPMFLT